MSVRVDKGPDQLLIGSAVEIVVEGSRSIDNRHLRTPVPATSLRVVDGSKGLFVACPQESYTDKDGSKKYANVFFPITNAAKTELQDAVLKAYDQYLDHQHTASQNRQWESQDEGMLPFDM